MIGERRWQLALIEKRRQKDENETNLFYQTDEYFQFIVSDKLDIMIDKEGNCLKNGELIKNDTEFFELLKTWLNHFMKIYNEEQ